MFDTHTYWMNEYKRQRIINVVKNIHLKQITPVKFAQDKFFSSITVRVHASMIDYKESEDGKVMSGETRRSIEFAEYWTFIRGHGAKTSPLKADNTCCPSCGAELKINMSGICEYCESKITSGDFDWVLSSIEQDSAYAG
jgi:uncharacterized protein (DUF2235 family)